MSKVSVVGHGLHKSFGKKQVVKDVDVRFSQGEIVGLLGPNGAGKTTTFYMLAGILVPTAGTVVMHDKDITDWPLYQRARAGMSYLPQESSVFKKLSVYENLRMILEYSTLSKKEQHRRCEEVMEEFGIARLRDSKASYLSGGERRRLEIARAIIQKPMFILLDEPFAGIDPLAVEDIQKIVAKLRDKGLGILISDHNVRETLKICDRANLVYDGQVILDGSPEKIVNDSRARKLYLGDEFFL